MQNSTTPQEKEFDPVADLITRLKIAYRFLTSKKAIIIIDNNLDIFNMDEMEVLAVSSQIVGQMSQLVYEDMEQDMKIRNLIASA